METKSSRSSKAQQLGRAIAESLSFGLNIAIPAVHRDRIEALIDQEFPSDGGPIDLAIEGYCFAKDIHVEPTIGMIKVKQQELEPGENPICRGFEQWWRDRRITPLGNIKEHCRSAFDSGMDYQRKTHREAVAFVKTLVEDSKRILLVL